VDDDPLILLAVSHLRSTLVQRRQTLTWDTHCSASA